VLGAAVLLVLMLWKRQVIAGSLKRRLKRQDRSTLPSLIGLTALSAGVSIGLLWTLHVISFDTLWGYSPLNIHVALGILLLPFVGWHMFQRRRQNLGFAPVRSRRTLLQLAGLVLASGATWQVMERASALALPPLNRLQSGSKHIGSFNANAYPAEIWLLDSVPSIDPQSWRMQFNGLVTPAALGIEDLHAFPRTEMQAILDCTSGWWTEQLWSGYSLHDVLNQAGIRPDAREVAVQSVTGHRCVFPLDDLSQALLVTHIGGEPLSPGHGAPVRLAVPGRRGYQWVKWIDRIDVA
jgi:hypothetical protein